MRGDWRERLLGGGRLIKGVVMEPTGAVRAISIVSLVAAIAAVAIAVGLLVVSVIPDAALGEESHALLSALPLALVALAYLLHQPRRKPTLGQAIQATLLCAAFLLWAAAQLHPSFPPVVNDAAIALFVVDLTLVVASDVRHETSGDG